jgi:peptide deformylase
MIRPIVLYGDPVLEQISAEVGSQYSKPDIQLLIDDLFETMHRAKGIGLSAVQIGVPLRIFVIEAHLPEENFHLRGAFINPRILKEFGELVKHPEGCLSVPGLAGLVERPESIEMEYLDEEWNPHTKIFSGYAARVIQHEYDHLKGKMYIEYLDQMWLKTMEESLRLIKDRKMEIPYSWK